MDSSVQKEKELLDSLSEDDRAAVLDLVSGMEKQNELLNKKKVLPKKRHKSVMRKRNKQQKQSRKNNR